jgi:hypothetical protein
VVASKIDTKEKYFIYFGCMALVAFGSLISMLFFRYKPS